MIRWPEKIKAGQVSDEIFASLDWMPTLAALIGEETHIPKDRPIDGIDQSNFLLGDQEKSNREHVLVYIGDELFSVKWQTFKIHMKTMENLWAPPQTYAFPRVYDVANDPGEEKGRSYYYVTSTGEKRKWIKLSDVYTEALAKWAELEGSTPSGETVEQAIDRYLVEVLPLKAEKTRIEYSRQALKFRTMWGSHRLDEIRPMHIAQYLDQHPHKITGNREVSVLSSNKVRRAKGRYLS